MKYILPILFLFAASLSAAPVTLSWQDNSDNETSFVIERAGSSGDFREVATLEENVTTYTDEVPEGTYQYRVKARRAGHGDSDYTNTVEAEAEDPLNAPTMLVITVTVKVIVQ